MPKITDAIGEAGFELVRNRIGEILITELAEQHDLNPITGVTNATVYIERFRSFDNVEVPAVNVTIATDEFGQRTAVSGDGTVTYNIDCYTSAPTTASVAGDTSAMVRLQRLLGICRAILMDSRYLRLDFNAPFIMSRAVTSMQLSKPVDAQDGLSMVMGRLVMAVRIPEEVSQAVLLEIAGYDTQVKLGLTNKGYVFSGDNIPVPPVTGSEISVNGTLFAIVDCGQPLNIPLLNSVGDNVGAVTFETDVIAPDATWTLVDTTTPDPIVLGSGSIGSGGHQPIVAPPVTVLRDGQAFAVEPSGGTVDVPSDCPPCADGSVRINDDPVATVASGGWVNIMVEQDGNPVGAFDPDSNSWVVPSCPSAPAVSATGGTETDITVSGIDYRLHTFTTSGTLTVTVAGMVRVLIVGGGGAGGQSFINQHCGGGGGGGGVVDVMMYLEPGTYAVTVGVGGAAPVSLGSYGSNGSPSVFNGVTAIGGGCGGFRDNTSARVGRDGGSGGGGGGNAAAGGLGTVAQGEMGGAGSTNAANGAGAGGGAGAAGQNADAGGAGGNGRTSDITGTAVYYGGGGGGGRFNVNPVRPGGLGGGGAGGAQSHVNGVAGTDGLGGGGGGNGHAGVGSVGSAARGGNGIIIIRYQL